MKKTICFLAELVTLVLAISMGAASTANAASAADLRHDPNRPFRAWAFCIDATWSLRSDEFVRMRGVQQDMVRDGVSYNDMVFLVEIQSGLGRTRTFEMPPGSSGRSNRDAAEQALKKAKDIVVDAIGNEKQTAGTTDLQSAFEVALDLLHDQPDATQLLLVAGSDFLTDPGKGKVSVAPPAMFRSGAAQGVDAILLLTYPKAVYFQSLRLSPSGYKSAVESNWNRLLTSEGASTVTLRLVDALPGASETAVTADDAAPR